MSLRVSMIVAVCVLAVLSTARPTFADVPTPEQARQYIGVMQTIITAAQSDNPAPLIDICTEETGKWLEGDGTKPLFNIVHDIGEVKSLDCPYILDRSATVRIVGSKETQYFNLLLTRDGKLNTWSNHGFQPGKAMAARAPQSAYLAVAEALVAGMNHRNLDAVASMFATRCMENVAPDWKQQFLGIAAKTGELSTNFGDSNKGADCMVYTLNGATAACVAGIELDAGGKIYRINLREASNADSNSFSKTPTDVYPRVAALVQAINTGNVDELENLFASNVAKELPASKALPYITRVHLVTGALNSLEFDDVQSDAFGYKAIGASGNLSIYVTLDEKMEITWLSIMLLDDDSPANKAHQTIPNIAIVKQAG